jgi:hypothetical protein
MGEGRSADVKSKPQPVNQHWVPKFYLRYFATQQTRETDSPQVWIFSKRDEDGDEKLTHVRNVCAKRFLYTPFQQDGSRSWDLENRLGEVETLLGSRWPEFAEGYVELGDEDVRKGLSLFVAIMHLRNPAVREQVERMHQSILDSFKDAPLRPDGNPDVEEVDINGKVHAIDTHGWQAYRAWGKNEHDRFFADMVKAQTGDIAMMLLKKRWSVVCCDTDVFITTDKPVAMHHQQREKCGFGTPGVIVTFPLGPKRLLVMDDLHHEPANQYYPLKDGNAGTFNMTTWHGGSRFMITGRPISEVLAELVALDDR